MVIGQVCCNCDSEMQDGLFHNCLRGLTDNINRLRHEIESLKTKKLDHLDGLKYALDVIEQMRQYYDALGVDYSKEQHDPFNDLTNRIRTLLGMRPVSRF